MFDAPHSRILIIDDNLINRKKLRLAVTNLGYHGETAIDGAAGLAALRQGAFDAILLDMLMPGMDGFEVLKLIKSDEALRDLPVIVVSDLEGDTKSVSAAIEMGAEDFLPKMFDPVILDARLKASLRKKQFRDKELDYFRRINALTDAAERVEAGRFDEESLNLAAEARNNDPIGRLATVFQGMANEIHTREVKLLRRIQTLHCSILLLICGGLAGLYPSLSRLAAGFGANPIGMSVWVDLFAAGICTVLVLFRGGLPKLSRSDVLFFIVWAFVVGILQHISIFVLAGHVQATYLTLVLALEGLLVFAFAALMRLEAIVPMRILGLLVGLVGVGISLSERMNGNSADANFWLLAAFIAPVFFAFETIAVAAKRPEHIDPIGAVGIMFAFATVLAFALALGTGNIIAPEKLLSPMGATLAALAFVTVATNVTFFILLKLGGGVFTSQKAYVTALAGLLWGIFLLGETISPLAWGAIAVVLLGMYLVGAKTSKEPITIQRNFGGPANDTQT
jgi:DNA-binding response OmpR family regulator/drug/metabolite transporter (DMT)-like permease